MNTYILLARHLGQVSGEKIYHFNKLQYMVALGWRVVFLSSKREKTPVDNAENYIHCVFPALSYTPECYTRCEVTKTVNDIVALIGEMGDKRCVIESDTANRAVWGELLARHLGAKHMVFLLQETHHYDDSTRAFLRFKYNRHELAGITTHSIHLILEDDRVEERDDTKIRAFCNNVVEDCEDSFSSQLDQEAEYTFGSIGRLDKGCVPAILDAYIAYAAARPEKKFNLVLIGGATGGGRIQRIRERVRKCPNIQLVITGYLYPIPESLINHIDLFVSTAGSANVSYRYHRPTVRVHPNTGEPAGIMGLDDLEGKTMYDVQPGVTLLDCIERVLSNRDQIEYVYNRYEDYYQMMNIEFERQLLLADIEKEKDYYDEEQLMRMRPTHIKGHALHYVVGHLSGAKGLNRFVSLYKKALRV